LTKKIHAKETPGKRQGAAAETQGKRQGAAMGKTRAFTMFDNEILEALIKIKLRQESCRTYLVIVRKTAGYQKDVDTISLSQFEEATGMKKRTVFRALKDLLDRNMIIKTKKGSCCRYSLADVDKWKVTCETGDTGDTLGDTGVTCQVSYNDKTGVLFAADSGDTRAAHNIKYINNTKESEENGSCKVTTKGLTKGQILKHAMKNDCFDKGPKCNTDCNVWDILHIIELKAKWKKEGT
jgi:phage replication O-like protein O